MSAQSGPSDNFNELTIDEIEAADDVAVTELPNMLLIEIDDMMTYVSNTAKNKLLFDREQYSVNGKSLYTLLHGNDDTRVVIASDPYIALSPTQHEDVYRLWYGTPDRNSVRTPVGRVEDVLNGIIDVVEDDEPGRFQDVYDHVINNQVRREVVGLFLDYNKLPTDRIEVMAEGWVIDGMFLVTWDTEVYLWTDSWKEGSYDPRRSTQYEQPGEFVTANPKEELEPMDLNVGTQTYRFGKLERLFIYRVNWMLDWEHNIDDPAKVATIKRAFNEFGDIL